MLRMRLLQLRRALEPLLHPWPKDVKAAQRYLQINADVGTSYGFGFVAFEGGYLIRFHEGGAFFWVRGGKLHAINATAERWAPQLERAPIGIIEEAAVKAVSDRSRNWRAAALWPAVLTAKQAEKLEEELKRNPDSFSLHLILFRHYSTMSLRAELPKASPAEIDALEAIKPHLLWLITNRPRFRPNSPEFYSTHCMGDKDFCRKVTALWLEHARNHPDDPDILGNAAGFLARLHPRRAMTLLEKAHAIEPDEPQWARELAMAYLSLAKELGEVKSGHWMKRMLREGDTARPELSREVGDLLGLQEASGAEPLLCEQVAARAFALYDAAAELKSGKDDLPDCSLLPDLTELAFSLQQWDRAERYANRMLTAFTEMGRRRWSDYFMRDFIGYAHSRLGRLALKKGERGKAVEHLLLSVRRPSMHAPDLTLARELLEAGERDAVVRFLRYCRRYHRRFMPWYARINPWSHWRRLSHPPWKRWIAAIERGKTPVFDRR